MSGNFPFCILRYKYFPPYGLQIAISCKSSQHFRTKEKNEEMTPEHRMWITSFKYHSFKLAFLVGLSVKINS